MTSKEVLNEWVSKSIQQRVRLFNLRYPQNQTSVYKLRKLYYKHGIKKKAIKIGKIPRPPNLYDMLNQGVDLRNEVQAGLENRLKLI